MSQQNKLLSMLDDAIMKRQHKRETASVSTMVVGYIVLTALVALFFGTLISQMFQSIPKEKAANVFILSDYRGERLDKAYRHFAADGGTQVGIVDASGKKRTTKLETVWYVSKQSIKPGTSYSTDKQLILYVVSVNDNKFSSKTGNVNNTKSLDESITNTLLPNLKGLDRVSDVSYSNGKLSLSLALNSLVLAPATKFAAWQDIHRVFQIAQDEGASSLTIIGTLEEKDKFGNSLGQQKVLLVSFDKEALEKANRKELFGSKLGTIATVLEYYGTLG